MGNASWCQIWNLKNACNAIDLLYYDQLKVEMVEYKTVRITKYLKHLGQNWWKIDTNTRKRMNVAYYEKWNQEYLITVFHKRLNNEQANLNDVRFVITNKDKLQFYIKWVYDSATFDKEETTKGDKKKKSDRTWTNETNYFEDIIFDTKK